VHLVGFITRTCVVLDRTTVRYLTRYKHSVPTVLSLQALQLPRYNCRGKRMNERKKASKKERKNQNLSPKYTFHKLKITECWDCTVVLGLYRSAGTVP